MTYDLDDRLMMAPVDAEADARTRRLRELGIGDHGDPEFDEFARRLAGILSAPFAMVNLIDDRRQFFAGLYTPETDAASSVVVAPADPDAGREMPGDSGYCPHVIARRRALVLEDVCDYPRFAGDPIVDEMGVRSYMGAPLIDSTGVALGTVCVGDIEPHSWGRPGLEAIKSMASQVVARINLRDGRPAADLRMR
ncbi:MAG TPA: GAF domain-containing protein [Stackebrandtia sp.]|jgi:GAF domain-containing protein|uniref:GAF domain-containing protein n=1 Tax=Stackebrandtia sp. TaxID=2023065 RepID=UPI002D4F7337|nr:GAF domain-containing protein [Stackebrandtia sp.]HZE41053.1 GAF domain-containing protein [Stackebrandtia sp.]